MKKYYLILLFCIAFFGDANAQPTASLFLPADSILYRSLDKYHQQLTAAELEEFDSSNRGLWMNFIPSIGIGYTPAGDPRPTTSFSLSQVLAAKRNRQSLEAKRRAINQAAQLRHQNDRHLLAGLIRQYGLLKKEFAFGKQLFEIDTELFEFYKAQFKNHELTASQFLLKRKSYLTTKNNLFKLESKLEEKRMEVFEAARLELSIN